MITNSNDKIEKVLNSLNGIDRAAANPYFFTRLEARMTGQKSFWENVSSFLSKPAIAIASISFVVMVNAFVIFSKTPTVDNNPKAEIAGLMDQYSQLGTNNLFEFENAKP